MNSRKQTPLILRICVALIAIAFVFSAPASHAKHQRCSAEIAASIGHSHGGEHHSKSKAALGDEACCSTLCAVCVVVGPYSGASLLVSVLPTRSPDLQEHLTGIAPSPAFKPPQPGV